MQLSVIERFLKSGELVPILPSYATIPVETHLLWPTRPYQIARHRYIIDWLVGAASQGFVATAGSMRHG